MPFIYIINRANEKREECKQWKKELFNLILEEEVKKWVFLLECKQTLLKEEDKKDAKSYLVNGHC